MCVEVLYKTAHIVQATLIRLIPKCSSGIGLSNDIAYSRVALMNTQENGSRNIKVTIHLIRKLTVKYKPEMSNTDVQLVTGANEGGCCEGKIW